MMGAASGLPGGQSEGTTTVIVTVTDGANSLTTTAAVSISVTGVNDGATAAPRVAATPNDGTVSGNLLTDAPAVAHPQGLAVNVTKVEGAGFAGSIPVRLASGATIAVSGDGRWVYDPKGRTAGAEVITYAIEDGKGLESASTLTITVTAA